MCRNPMLLWFHIARSEGFFATDAERLDRCLSDTHFAEEVDRIPREPTQPIPPGSHHGEEHQSHMEDSSESSNSESEVENSDAEQSEDDDGNGNESGDEAGNADDATDMLNADDLLFGQALPGSSDGNANEAEQSRSQETIDETANAPTSQPSRMSVTTQVATQTLPPRDSLEPLLPTGSELSQQEQPQERAKSNAQEQVHVVLDKAS